MHHVECLVYLTCLAALAFLLVDAHFIRERIVSPPDWFIIQNSLCATEPTAPPRDPCLAAETEERLPTRRDGLLAGHQTRGVRTRFFSHPLEMRLLDSRVWKPWQEGG